MRSGGGESRTHKAEARPVSNRVQSPVCLPFQKVVPFALRSRDHRPPGFSLVLALGLANTPNLLSRIKAEVGGIEPPREWLPIRLFESRKHANLANLHDDCCLLTLRTGRLTMSVSYVVTPGPRRPMQRVEQTTSGHGWNRTTDAPGFNRPLYQ